MYFKKNLWQRIKFAFKTLLSDAPLVERKVGSDTDRASHTTAKVG